MQNTETDDPEDVLGAVEISENTAQLVDSLNDLIEDSHIPAEDIILAVAITLMWCFEGMKEAVDEGASVDTASVSDCGRIITEIGSIISSINKKNGN